MKKYKTWIEISKNSIRRNIFNLKDTVSDDCFLMFVVKSNAYGLGINNIIPLTKDIVDWYGVDSVDEAILIRRLCNNPILIMGHASVDRARDIIQNDISVNAYDYKLVSLLSAYATLKRPLKVHIKIDSGLSRLGFLPKNSFAEIKKISKIPNVLIEGIFTHFPKLFNDSDEEVYFDNFYQFNKITNYSNFKFIHAASSVAAILCPELRFNMIRFGILAYGVWGRRETLGLIERKNKKYQQFPAVSIKTTVISVKRIKSGTNIGYGYSNNINKDTVVAVLGMGFFDGIDRRYSEKGEVLIRGRRAKILGKISMNMFMVDVSNIQGVKIGDEVVIIGKSKKEEIDFYEFTDKIGISVYEAMSRINQLTPIVIVK